MKKQRPKGPAGASWSALQGRRSRENLAYALAISVYVHWLILALRFGVPALGIPGLIGPQIERSLLRLEMTTRLGQVPNAPSPSSDSPPLPLSLSRVLPPPGAENHDLATVQRAPGAPLEVRIVRLPEPVATPPASPALPPPPPQVAQRKPAPKPRKLARKPAPPRVLTQKAPAEETFKVPQPKLAETPSPTPAPAPAPEAIAETPPVDPPSHVAEAERLAAESREKEAQARREAEAEIEAKRLAAERAREQALALAQAEAEAVRKAEEARRIEAAQQEEAKRLALEAEAKANAAEAEAQRIAQETEAKRLIAEAEAKRVPLAAEAKRLAQEAEAKRLAVEAETKRLALEAETLRRLQETAREQARREAEAAEAQRQAAEQKRLAEEAAKRQAAERQRAAADDAARAERERQAGVQAPGAPGQTPGTAPPPLSGRELAEKALEQIRRPGSLTLDPQKRGIPFALPENPRRRLITKAERDVSLRMYADSWRDKIERHGSFNYRESATWRLHEPVIVTVAIRSDGTLEDVRINRSSGVRELDQAVFRITRLLAPYSAFPPDLARQYDVIEIRRVWSFDRTIRILDEM